LTERNPVSHAALDFSGIVQRLVLLVMSVAAVAGVAAPILVNQAKFSLPLRIDSV
jgi:hypothetical protein